METSEARQIERWIRREPLLLGRTIPGVLEDNQRRGQARAGLEEDSTDRCAKKSRSPAPSSSARCSRTWRRCGGGEYLKSEQASGGGPGRAVHHMSQMVQPINEMAKLP